MDRSLHKAITVIIDQRSSVSPPSFSENALDTWAGLGFDHLHRMQNDDGAERSSPSKKHTALASCDAVLQADQAPRVPAAAARILVLLGPA
jgi:hypothetical protein